MCELRLALSEVLLRPGTFSGEKARNTARGRNLAAFDFTHIALAETFTNTRSDSNDDLNKYSGLLVEST